MTHNRRPTLSVKTLPEETLLFLRLQAEAARHKSRKLEAAEG